MKATTNAPFSLQRDGCSCICCLLPGTAKFHIRPCCCRDTARVNDKWHKRLKRRCTDGNHSFVGFDVDEIEDKYCKGGVTNDTCIPDIRR